MSRAKTQTKESLAFIARFAEVCGSSKPAEVARLLNIAYQTAKNYLNGRLPHPEVLITIAQRTPYSINWLLTGRGKKIVDDDRSLDTPIPTGQMESFVRRICVEVINEMNGREESILPKIVVLQPEDILSEKVAETTAASTERRSE
jgi:transcriptional regulator with XRE-family HTH domain